MCGKGGVSRPGVTGRPLLQLVHQRPAVEAAAKGGLFRSPHSLRALRVRGWSELLAEGGAGRVL
eukprot:4747163-Alexandrium_andersonii.AAC.1